MNPFDIEEAGVDVRQVRKEVLAVIGDRTIISHQLPIHIMRLGLDPNDIRKNEQIDIAMDNRVNFEMMVKEWVMKKQRFSNLV